MKLVSSHNRQQPDVSTGALPRVRPGERPTWWDMSADRDMWPQWRLLATRAGMSLDAWVSLSLEFELVCADLREAGITDPEMMLQRLAETRPGTTRIPPPSLRSWHDLLGREPGSSDELPEVVVPLRLAQRLPPGRRLDSWLQRPNSSLVIACDRAAAREGRTLESWALRGALRLRSNEPG